MCAHTKAHEQYLQILEEGTLTSKAIPTPSTGHKNISTNYATKRDICNSGGKPRFKYNNYLF